MRGSGQNGAHAFENSGELGDYTNDKSRRDEYDKGEGDDGIGHGPFYTTLEFFTGFHIIGELQENTIKVTTCFTSTHHTYIKIGKCFGVFSQGIGKGFAGFNIVCNSINDECEIWIVGLLCKNIQALHKGQTCTDDGSKLACKN